MGGDPSRDLELRAQIWADTRGSGPRQELPGAGGCSLGAGTRAKPAHLEQPGAGVAKGWLSHSSPTTLCHGDCWETPNPPLRRETGQQPTLLGASMHCTAPCCRLSAHIHVLCLFFLVPGCSRSPPFPQTWHVCVPRAQTPNVKQGSSLEVLSETTASGWEDLGFASGYAAPRGATRKNPKTPPQAAEDREGLSAKSLRANRVVAVVSLREQMKERRHYELPRVRLWECFSNSRIS